MDAVVLVLAAAGGVSPLVADLGLCLVAAGLLAVLFERLRIPTIAALLGAGVLLGPAGVAGISDAGNIDTIANLGLTLLLFIIGLEVDPRSLLARGRPLIVTGLLQVPITVAAGTGFFLLLGAAGWAASSGGYAAFYLGVACGFSSTLLVVKLLQAHRLLDTIRGRMCVGLLIFQDVWAIVILAVQPSFSDPAVAPILLTFLGIAILALVATGVARALLPHAFQAVARSPELVVTVALGWCFGVGLFGAHLGDVAGLIGIDVPISVSLEMGALIAGATIATSAFAHEVVTRVTHLRDFFVTLFFVGLGLSIPVPDGVAVVALAAVLALVACALRYLVFLPLLYATGLDRRNSTNIATLLAQVSEFCLVIAYLGARLGHIGPELVSVVIFAFVMTALATPVLFGRADRIYARLRGLLGRVGIRSRGAAGEEEGDEHQARLVLLGFHRIASALLADLERTDPDLLAATLVIDTNSSTHAEIRRRGARVVYGDIGNAEVLRHAGVASAEVIVSTVPDTILKGTSNEQLVRTVRTVAPTPQVIANCMQRSQVAALREAGADHVFRAASEVAVGILPAVLAALGGGLASYRETLEEERGPVDRPEVMD